jgi:hypothetical protein
MSQIILHHYALSPYSEKTRLALGLKDLNWRVGMSGRGRCSVTSISKRELARAPRSGCVVSA